MQLPLFQTKSDWQPPSLSDLPSWKGVGRVGIDTETCDPHLKKLGIGVRRPCPVDGAGVVGISFAIEDGPKFYLPIRHQGGDNMDPDGVKRYLREQFKYFDGELVGANISYDLDYLWEEGIEMPLVKFFRDIQVADPLIYELHNSYSLKNIAERHGLPGKNEDRLREAAANYGVSPKGDMWKLPARFVGEYAEDDAANPLAILRRQERLINEKDLWDIYDLESQITPILVKLRRRGVKIDQDKLEQIENWSLTEEAKALKEVERATLHRINVGDVWKADALAPALEAIGVKLEQTSTGKPSIRKDVLEGIEDPVAKNLAWARKVNKLRTTFAQSIRTYMVNGRIHCTFNQIARESDNGDQKGARYGRLSATDPNLQQQPSRDEFAAMWRSIYVAETDALWACCDYSQQEPRWTTHFAAKMDLPKAKEAAQAYHDNPLLDNHQFMADLTGLKRKFAKNLFLGLCYGEGGAKLCSELGLPTRWAIRLGRGHVEYCETEEEAYALRAQNDSTGFIWRAAGAEGQSIIDQFDDRAPYIRELAKRAQRQVDKVGFIKTFGGRKLNFTRLQDGSYDYTHKSLNRLIQGSSADQTKRAMVELDKAGHFIQLQVHDEVDGSMADVAEAKRVGEIMANCVEGCLVPFRVDVEVGPSWGEIEEVK